MTHTSGIVIDLTVEDIAKLEGRDLIRAITDTLYEKGYQGPIFKHDTADEDTFLVTFNILIKEEKKRLGEYYFKHDNGTTRSRTNRWSIARTVACPECLVSVGDDCENNGNYTRYPHNKRFREGYLRLKETDKNSPLL